MAMRGRGACLAIALVLAAQTAAVRATVSLRGGDHGILEQSLMTGSVTGSGEVGGSGRRELFTDTSGIFVGSVAVFVVLLGAAAFFGTIWHQRMRGNPLAGGVPGAPGYITQPQPQQERPQSQKFRPQSQGRPQSQQRARSQQQQQKWQRPESQASQGSSTSVSASSDPPVRPPKPAKFKVEM